MDIHALRYYPFTDRAEDIIRKVIDKKTENNFTRKNYAQYDFYQKTSIDIVANKDFIRDQLLHSEEKNDWVYRSVVRPFTPWLSYARPTVNNPNNLALNTLLYEDYKTFYQKRSEKKSGSVFHASRNEGLYQTIGHQNILYFLDEVFGDIDLYRDRNEIMLLSFKSPLANDALETYRYYLSGKRQVNGRNCLEIIFYSTHTQENAFAGYLYVSDDSNYALEKAIFTLNNASNMNFLKEVLITHTYAEKEDVRIPEEKAYSVLLGDEMRGSLIVNRTSNYYGFNFTEPGPAVEWKHIYEKGYTSKDSLYWEQHRPVALTPAQTQVTALTREASHSTNYRNFQNLVLVLMNNHFSLGGINGAVELGPLTQFVSYNSMEGLRLKAGGNTTLNFSDRFMFGGYTAYGFMDERFKYRLNLGYSLLPRERYLWEFPKRLFSFTYVNDLNIPGQDLLTSTRDEFFYSFSHASTNNMSLQKIGLLTFEDEMSRIFSFKLGGKYTYDRPLGVVQYMQVQGVDTTIVNYIETSEISFSLRYNPRERFIQNRDKRIYIRRGDVDLNVNHRVGIKGFLGSDYNYQITDFKAYKKFFFPRNTGTLDLEFSGGKVWNRVPFPLLFIPSGNQSYIFLSEGYNCMNFYEFITDNYVAGNVNMMFNWSPFKILSKKSKIKTSIGGRVIYGPLSDNNNPEIHPELFALNEGVNPLGSTPYAEVNIGLANVLKFLRIEYVRRLTYLGQDEESGGHKISKGNLFLTGSFSF